VELIQGTNLLGGDVLQHAKHAGTRGSRGMPFPLINIDGKILQFRDISTYIQCFILLADILLQAYSMY